AGAHQERHLHVERRAVGGERLAAERPARVIQGEVDVELARAGRRLAGVPLQLERERALEQSGAGPGAGELPAELDPELRVEARRRGVLGRVRGGLEDARGGRRRDRRGASRGAAGSRAGAGTAAGDQRRDGEEGDEGAFHGKGFLSRTDPHTGREKSGAEGPRRREDGSVPGRVLRPGGELPI